MNVLSKNKKKMSKKYQLKIYNYYNAFSHLLGKKLVPMKTGKLVQFFSKLLKNSVIFSQIWERLPFKLAESLRSIGKFFSRLGKYLVPVPVLYRERSCIEAVKS